MPDGSDSGDHGIQHPICHPLYPGRIGRHLLGALRGGEYRAGGDDADRCLYRGGGYQRHRQRLAGTIVSGLAIIIFAAGITVFFAWLLYNQTQIKAAAHLRVPLLHDIPWFKVLFSEIPPTIFLTAVIVIASHFIIFKTVFGLRLRSVGEHPQAADTLGISVDRMRYTGVIISGALSGMAGAYLSLEHAHYFVKGISAGRGFIGLASMIFGKWTPFGTAGAGLLFGFGEALKPYLPKIVPSQFIDMIPYVLTIFVLASAIGRATPPAAIGIPYIKE
jgi:simple sugar transport system permease protein